MSCCIIDKLCCFIISTLSTTLVENINQKPLIPTLNTCFDYTITNKIFLPIRQYLNVYLSICFFLLKTTINTYLKLEIRVVCREFFAFKYVVIVFFRNKTDDYSYLYIRNLENSRLKTVLNTTL